jgi:hypothetical protein
MGRSFIKSAPDISTFSCLILVYGILRGYLRHALWFMLTTLATLPGFRKGIKKHFPHEWAMTASLPAWMYIRLKNKVGGPKAFELLRAAFLPVSMALFGVTFRVVESPRTFDNMVQFHEMARKGLFSNAEEETVEYTDSRFEYRCTSCGYVDLFKYLGVPELTPMFCSADNAFYNSYAPNQVTFSRGGPGNMISEGATHCTFIYEKHGQKQ